MKGVFLRPLTIVALDDLQPNASVKDAITAKTKLSSASSALSKSEMFK